MTFLACSCPKLAPTPLVQLAPQLRQRLSPQPASLEPGHLEPQPALQSNHSPAVLPRPRSSALLLPSSLPSLHLSPFCKFCIVIDSPCRANTIHTYILLEETIDSDLESFECKTGESTKNSLVKWGRFMYSVEGPLCCYTNNILDFFSPNFSWVRKNVDRNSTM